MMLSNRCSESPFNRPSSPTEAVEQGALTYANLSRPLSYGHCSVAKGEEVVTPSIVGLLNFSGPFAVFRRVRAIVVDTLNGVFRIGLWPHVSVEGSKVIPLWVNGNAASAVEMVSWAVRVVASLVYALPRAVFWGPCHTMRGSQSCCYFLAQAATTLSTTCMKTITYHSDLIPTVALTEPYNTSASVWSTSDDDQSPISKSSSVNQFRHFIISKMKAALRRAQVVVTQLAPKGSGFPRYDCVVQAV